MKRIDLLDAWRSLAILCMLVYHFLYDLTVFGFMETEKFESPGLDALQLFICCSFILVSGISSRFSRNNVGRGLIVLCAGLLVMLGAYVAGEPILFGILQFLGVATIIYGLAGKYIERLNRNIAAPLFLVLFAVTWVWTENTLVEATWLWPLGFIHRDFYSADYFPLMPWFFLFLFGTWVGGIIKELKEASWLHTPLHPALTWPGRHSLLIYLLHQPVLYGICWAASELL
ncbi:MAG: heparan-alpha-glucosaminide N-acetyltransferase [Oscillospiraceae bacterium]|jgi:uncharacterized membrane protein